MKEIYVIYKKSSGRIVSSGKLDREWDSLNLDGSTSSERIEAHLENNININVVYSQRHLLPDKNTEKINGGKIVSMSESDIEEDQVFKDEQENARVEIETKLQLIAGKTHVDLDSYLDSNEIINPSLRMISHVVLALVHNNKINL